MDMKLGDFICSVINKKVNLEMRLADYLIAIDPKFRSYSKSLLLVDRNKFHKQLVKYLSENAEQVLKKVQPHGNWRERTYNGRPSYYYCSACGFEIDMFAGGTYNYCPRCGAKMDETEAGA